MEGENAVRREPEWKQMYHKGAGKSAASSPERRDRQVVLVVEDDILHAVADVIGPAPPDAGGQPPTMDTD